MPPPINSESARVNLFPPLHHTRLSATAAPAEVVSIYTAIPTAVPFLEILFASSGRFDTKVSSSKKGAIDRMSCNILGLSGGVHD